MQDYYKVLEVEENADLATIKKSYRKLVLKYHPDKNPENREEAEEKIRLINDAYETVSNPTKKAAWEAQKVAMKQKQQGVRIDTSRIQPCVNIPKKFMVNPMGHPDQFLRAQTGNSLSFQARNSSDCREVGFEEFFDCARFSIWWIKGEINNMCRMRRHVGVDSTMVLANGKGPDRRVAIVTPNGLNLSFGLMGQSQSDVMVTPVEDPYCCNIIAVASPTFAGAYRFEAAYFPGHYLAFCPPNQVQMVGAVDDFTIIDFLLTDFEVCHRFKTVDEILIPAVKQWDGHLKFINMDRILDDMNFRMTFQSIVGSTWDPEDFKSYFQGHSEKWEYDPATEMFRLRDEKELAAYALKRVNQVEELVNKFESQTFDWLPLEVIGHLLRTCGRPLPSDPTELEKMIKQLGVANHEPERFRTKYTSCQTKTLRFLKGVTAGSEKVLITLNSMIPLWMELEKFANKQVNSEIVKECQETLKALKECIENLIEAKESTLDIQVLGQLLSLGLDWKVYAPLLAKKAQQVVNMQPLEELVPLIQKAPKEAGALGECLATSALMKTFGAQPAVSVEALEAMAASGFGLDGAAMTLKMLFARAPFEPCARIIARLGEHDFKGDDLKGLCEMIAVDEKLKSVSPGVLVQLTMAAAKSSVLADCVFAVACSAVSSQLASDSWPADELARLLQALNDVKVAGASIADSDDLLRRTPAVLTAKLGVVTAAQLLGIASALSKVPSCVDVLKAAAVQCASRVSDLQPRQLLQVTKDLLPLGGTDPSLTQILDYWEQTLTPSESEALVSATGDAISSRRIELERQNQLSTDQIALLFQWLVPAAPNHSIFEMLSKKLLGQMRELTSTGIASIEAALNEEKGPNFRSRSQLQKAVKDAQRAPKGGEQGDGQQKDPAPRQQRDPPPRQRDRSPRQQRDRSPGQQRYRDRSPRQQRDRSPRQQRERSPGQQRHRDRSPRQRDRSPRQQRYRSRSRGDRSRRGDSRNRRR